jgi:hypothetical protein
MEDGFEKFALCVVSKDDPREFIATDASVAADDACTKKICDLKKGRLIGFNNPAGDQVGVHDGEAAFTEKFIRCGFAHADTACESDDFHWQSIYGTKTVR